jgi:hypothetical protein
MYRHRQLHLWITEHDYSLLRDLADERNETLSSVIRRLIKLHRTGAVFSTDDEPSESPATSAL